MQVINMHDAKTRLSQLVEQALRGDEILIARRGVAVVQLVPVASEMTGDLRPIGLGSIDGAPASPSDPQAYSIAEEFSGEDNPTDPLNW